MDTQSAFNTRENLPIVVGITGASASIVGLRLLAELLRLNRPVEVVITEKAYPVIQTETGLKLGGGSSDEKASRLVEFLGLSAEKARLLQFFHNNEMDGSPASGSHLTQGMVIAPCSMGTLARVALGLSDKLISRAADVTLKEGRKLILVPRETPLNRIHLQNMLTLSQMGAVMIPPVLSFYQPEFHTIDGQIQYTVGKILDQLGLHHDLHTRWQSPDRTSYSQALCESS